MRKAALIAVGALALPLAFSLPAVAAGPMEQAQQEGFRQAQEAAQKNLSPDQIKQVQEALNQKGFHVGRTDGVMGTNTKQALTKFQQSKKLEQTGQPDDLTLEALGVDLNGTPGAATTGTAPPSDRNQPFDDDKSGDGNGEK